MPDNRNSRVLWRGPILLTWILASIWTPLSASGTEVEDISKSVEKLILKQETELQNDRAILEETDQALKKKEVKDLKKHYLRSRSIWQKLVDDALSNYSELESNALEILSKTEKAAKAQEESSFSLENEVGQLEKSITILINKNNALLAKASHLRSQTLILNSRTADFQVIDEDYVSDLKREVRLVPYWPFAYARNKVNWARSQVENGLPGWLVIFHETGVFIFVLLLPIIIGLSFRKGLHRMDRFRRTLLQRRGGGRALPRIAYLMGRSEPYLPWLTALFTLEVIIKTLGQTQSSELGLFVPFLELYVVYKLFTVATGDVIIELVSYRVGLRWSSQLSRRLQTSVLKFARLLFGILLVNELIFDVAKHGFLYTNLSILIWSLLPIGLLWLEKDWNTEIRSSLQESELGSLGPYLARKCEGALSPFFGVLGLIVLFLRYIFLYLKSRFNETDLVKRIKAQVLKQRLASSSENTGSITTELKLESLPEEYRQVFHLDAEHFDNIHIPHKGVYEEINRQIQSWKEEKSNRHTLVLTGEKGVGKSTLLNWLAELPENDLEIALATVPAKLTDKEEVDQFFAFLESDFATRDETAWKKSDVIFKPGPYDPKAKNKRRRLILLDDAQNFFIGKPGGFEGLRRIAEKTVDEGSENAYWILAFNSHAWSYANQAIDAGSLFGSVIHFPAWSDEDLRELVLSRHEKTGFSLQFSFQLRAAAATGSETGADSLQTRYFNLLWDVSGGLPRSALSLWISSITQIYGKQVEVGFPSEVLSPTQIKLSEDQVFLLASLIRHENLSLEELSEVLSLNPSRIHSIIQKCLECEYINQNSFGRYRIAPTWHSALLKILRQRNVIYGNR